MSTARQGAPGQSSQAPRQTRTIDAILSKLTSQRLSHGPQLIDVLRNMSILDSHPLRQLHAGRGGQPPRWTARCSCGFPGCRSRTAGPRLWHGAFRGHRWAEEGANILLIVVLIYLLSFWPGMSSSRTLRLHYIDEYVRIATYTEAQIGQQTIAPGHQLLGHPRKGARLHDGQP